MTEQTSNRLSRQMSSGRWLLTVSCAISFLLIVIAFVLKGEEYSLDGAAIASIMTGGVQGLFQQAETNRKGDSMSKMTYEEHKSAGLHIRQAIEKLGLEGAGFFINENYPVSHPLRKARTRVLKEIDNLIKEGDYAMVRDCPEEFMANGNALCYRRPAKPVSETAEEDAGNE